VRKKELFLYPVEVVLGALILLGMATAGLAKSITLLPDWQRYRRIRSI
jgi:hypothetical protein